MGRMTQYWVIAVPDQCRSNWIMRYNTKGPTVKAGGTSTSIPYQKYPNRTQAGFSFWDTSLCLVLPVAGRLILHLCHTHTMIFRYVANLWHLNHWMPGLWFVVVEVDMPASALFASARLISPLCRKWVCGRKFPTLDDWICFACKLCQFSRGAPNHIEGSLHLCWLHFFRIPLFNMGAWKKRGDLLYSPRAALNVT